MQHAAFETVADVGDRAGGIGGGGEVDLDMVLRARVPRTILRERMPRAGDHAPAGRGETDHGGMADAAARPGQEQRTARRIAGGLRHEDLSDWSMIRTRRAALAQSVQRFSEGIMLEQNTRDTSASWTISGRPRHGEIRCGRGGGTGGRARTRYATA